MKNKINLLFFFMIFFIVLGACTSQKEPEAKLAAKLSELSGKVDIKNPGSDEFLSASADAALLVNGQIQTGDDGRVRLDLSSGTIIRVAPSSLFTLTSNEESSDGLVTKLKLDLGKIFIILNGGTADVETPSGVASVRGSYLKVEVDPDTLDIYITCLEGDCSASNLAGTVDFSDGQKTILFHKNEDGTWTIPGVESMSPEDFQDWLDNNPEAQELFNQASATMTAMATQPATDEPTDAPTAPPTIEPVVPGSDASNGCLQIIEPIDGNALPFQGEVKFEWESKPDAIKYIVTFINEDGNTVSLETTDTSIEKYIEEIIPNGGKYKWNVAAIKGDGTQLCKTEDITFEKPDSKYEPDEKPTEDPTEEPTKPPKPTKPPVVCDPNDCNGSCPDPDVCTQTCDPLDCQGSCPDPQYCTECDPCNIEAWCYDPGYPYCE